VRQPYTPPRIDTRQVLTIAAAAKQLRISRQALWQAIAKGWLTTVDIDGVIFVTKERGNKGGQRRNE